jgi:hypothetical protein
MATEPKLKLAAKMMARTFFMWLIPFVMPALHFTSDDVKFVASRN